MSKFEWRSKLIQQSNKIEQLQKEVLLSNNKDPVLKFKTPKASPYGDHESIVGGKLKLSDKIIKFDEENRLSPSFK